MLIILEGVDCSGKSTLASKIANNLVGDVQILHRGPPAEHPLIEYETPLFGYRPNEGVHIICDRWHVGEWVYPQVMRRKSVADDAIWTHIELFLRARGALSVFMPTRLHDVFERYKARGDNYVDVEQLDDLMRAYNDQYSKAITATIRDDSVSRIIRVGEMLEHGVKVKHNGSYIGAPRPNLLLVGERREFAEPYPPAFGPFKATSGHYLLSSLCAAKEKVAGVALANAYEEDLAEIWVQADYPRVVALGRRAQTELKRANVQHGAVPHPQYVRRFHHSHNHWYAGLITRAAYQQEDLAACRP